MPAAPGAGRRRQRMSAPARRAAILAAAQGEFARAGYDGASTASIAKAAGCSEAVLYQHFASKLDMLRAVLREMRQDRLGRVGGADGPVSIGDVVEGGLRDPNALANLRVLLGAIAVGHRDAEVTDALLEQFQLVRDAIVRLIRASQAQGTIDPDLDPEEVAWLWQGVFVAGLLRRSIREDEMAESALDAARLLSSLLAPDPDGREAS